MKKYIIILTLAVLVFYESKAQNTAKNFHSESFGLHAGLTLLENPTVLYPAINLSYSRTILGEERHQLALFPQLGLIALPEIETKILMSLSVQYKYISAKRFELNAYLGLNYQLRSLAYDRYQFEGNALVNKGSFLHQIGPTIGFNVGYKIVKKTNFSISPTVGFSLIKLNKSYQSDLLDGYKSSITFGIILNK